MGIYRQQASVASRRAGVRRSLSCCEWLIPDQLSGAARSVRMPQSHLLGDVFKVAVMLYGAKRINGAVKN
jgi:hypothetical protein